MINIFKGKTCNDAWIEAKKAFLNNKNVIRHAGRGGNTFEILHAVFQVENPIDRWIVSRCPPINPAFTIVDTFWVLSGRRDSKFINYWNKRLPKFAGSGKYYYGAYGYRLRNNLNIDQINKAYYALKNDNSSRQIVLQIWDPIKDLPYKNGKPRNKDIPCNLLSMLKIRDNKLEWMQIVRSNDMFLGVPQDLPQFTTIQEIICGWLDIELGTYSHLSDSLHIYERDYKKIEKQTTHFELETNRDSLRLPKKAFDKTLNNICCNIWELTKKQLSEKAIIKLINSNKYSKGYNNLFLIVASEAARKRKYDKLVDSIISECSNPILLQIWKRWETRVKKQQP